MDGDEVELPLGEQIRDLCLEELPNIWPGLEGHFTEGQSYRGYKGQVGSFFTGSNERLKERELAVASTHFDAADSSQREGTVRRGRRHEQRYVDWSVCTTTEEQ